MSAVPTTAHVDVGTRRRGPDQGVLDSAEAALRARVDGEVRFDTGSRAAYSTDASNVRQVPLAVVVPRTIDDAIQALAVCRDHDLPVVTRGGGTSLAGQSLGSRGPTTSRSLVTAPPT